MRRGVINATSRSRRPAAAGQLDHRVGSLCSSDRSLRHPRRRRSHRNRVLAQIIIILGVGLMRCITGAFPVVGDAGGLFFSVGFDEAPSTLGWFCVNRWWVRGWGRVRFFKAEEAAEPP